MVSRLAGSLGALGTAGTCASTLAALGCCGPAVLGPAAALLTTGVAWLPNAAQYEVLYASLALMLVGLVVNARRHRRRHPLSLGAVGAVALVLAFHEAWDLEVFRVLIWGGSAALIIAAIADLWSKRRACGRGDREARTGCAT